jgi:hypothetical protein
VSSSPIAPYGQSVSADRQKINLEANPLTAPPPPFPPPQVDERLNGDGTGLILGINDEILGFILLTIPALVFSQFFYAQKDEGIAAGGENDDSGLSL